VTGSSSVTSLPNTVPSGPKDMTLPATWGGLVYQRGADICQHLSAKLLISQRGADIYQHLSTKLLMISAQLLKSADVSAPGAHNSPLGEKLNPKPQTLNPKPKAH